MLSSLLAFEDCGFGLAILYEQRSLDSHEYYLLLLFRISFFVADVNRFPTFSQSHEVESVHKQKHEKGNYTDKHICSELFKDNPSISSSIRESDFDFYNVIVNAVNTAKIKPFQVPTVDPDLDLCQNLRIHVVFVKRV